MRLVRGIFSFWVIGDSSSGESGISGAGDSSPGLQGESSISYVDNFSPDLWGSLSSGLLAGDNSLGWGENWPQLLAVGDSCSSELELAGDFSSLRERGMDTLYSVLVWGLLWSQLKAASLYVMGKLGLIIQVDAVHVVEQVL